MEVEDDVSQSVREEVGVESSPRAIGRTTEVNPIIVDDRRSAETPIAEVTTDGQYGVEAMLDSGAGSRS
eukprot:3810707-Amphidinium_carterae.1